MNSLPEVKHFKKSIKTHNIRYKNMLLNWNNYTVLKLFLRHKKTISLSDMTNLTVNSKCDKKDKICTYPHKNRQLQHAHCLTKNLNEKTRT